MIPYRILKGSNLQMITLFITKHYGTCKIAANQL